MKTWQIVVVGLVSLAVAGCQTDPNIVLLEQDLRKKDDEIYRLQWQLEDCQAELQAARSTVPSRGSMSSSTSSSIVARLRRRRRRAPTDQTGARRVNSRG